MILISVKLKPGCKGFQEEKSAFPLFGKVWEKPSV